MTPVGFNVVDWMHLMVHVDEDNTPTGPNFSKIWPVPVKSKGPTDFDSAIRTSLTAVGKIARRVVGGLGGGAAHTADETDVIDAGDADGDDGDVEADDQQWIDAIAVIYQKQRAHDRHKTRESVQSVAMC